MLLALVFALVSNGCIGRLLPRDYYGLVEITNPNDFPVRYYSQGRAYPKTMRRIDAHQTVQDAWVLPGPDSRKWGGARTKVEATDERGNLVFCRILVYEHLEETGWRVDLVAGTLEC